MKKLLALLLLMVTIGTSCKKETPAPQKSKTDLLTQKPWLIKSYQEKVGGTWRDESPDARPSYKKDDLFIFKKDGTVEWNEGATKESAGSPQVLGTLTWSFKSHETILVFDGENQPIMELTENSFILQEAEDDPDGRIVFAHP